MLRAQHTALYAKMGKLAQLAMLDSTATRPRSMENVYVLRDISKTEIIAKLAHWDVSIAMMPILAQYAMPPIIGRLTKRS